MSFQPSHAADAHYQLGRVKDPLCIDEDDSNKGAPETRVVRFLHWESPCGPVTGTT